MSSFLSAGQRLCARDASDGRAVLRCQRTGLWRSVASHELIASELGDAYCRGPFQLGKMLTASRARRCRAGLLDMIGTNREIADAGATCPAACRYTFRRRAKSASAALNLHRHVAVRRKDKPCGGSRLPLGRKTSLGRGSSRLHARRSAAPTSAFASGPCSVCGAWARRCLGYGAHSRREQLPWCDRLHRAARHLVSPRIA